MSSARPLTSAIGRRLASPVPVSPAAARDFALAFAFWAFLTVVFASHFLIQRVNLRVGEVSPQDVYATHEVVNRPLTDRLRQQAARSVGPVYVTQKSALPKALAEAATIMAAVQEVAGHPKLAPSFSAITGLNLAPGMPRRVLALSARQLALVSALSRTLLREVMAAGYRSNAAAVSAAHQQIELTADGMPLPNLASRDLLVAVAEKAFRPTLVYSAAQTDRARQEAAAGVAPVYVLPGDLVVVKGSRVTAGEIAVLRALGLLRGRDNAGAVGGAALLAAALVAVAAFYVAFVGRRRAFPRSASLMLGLIAAGVILLAGLLVRISGGLVPLASASLLAALLVDPAAAVGVTLLLALAIAVAFGLDVPTTTTLVVGGLAGVAASVQVGARASVLRAVAYLLAAEVVAGLGFILLGDVSSGVGLAPWVNLGWAAAGAVLSGVLAFGFLPLFEGLFGILTSVRLTELVNPNQPLLHRLLMEAPGTYHHCVVVGNLAEAAAVAVGGNSLLARAGGLYHDIGKLRRPLFFVDNQFGADNPHDRLTPSLSSLIITSHVKDGLELAAEANLPTELRQFIAEHHGTTLVQYFWRKELARHEAGGADPKAPPPGVSETDFRYPGPKPHSKETAIVMLADTCEAAVRALPRPTVPRIEARVRQLIRERLADGQLDEADLTLRDLDGVARTFTQVLSGVFHSRVPYPENERGVPPEPASLGDGAAAARERALPAGSPPAAPPAGG